MIKPPCHKSLLAFYLTLLLEELQSLILVYPHLLKDLAGTTRKISPKQVRNLLHSTTTHFHHKLGVVVTLKIDIFV